MVDLASSISRLTVTKKFELLDAIWEDLGTRDPATVSEEQSVELDRRFARYQLNPESAIPWDYVKADLFKQ